MILPTASGVSNEGGSSPLLVPLPAVSWPWVPAWGLLEPPRQGGENAQKTGKNGEKMGEIRPKECEPRELTKDQLAGAAGHLARLHLVLRLPHRLARSLRAAQADLLLPHHGVDHEAGGGYPTGGVELLAARRRGDDRPDCGTPHSPLLVPQTAPKTVAWFPLGNAFRLCPLRRIQPGNGTRGWVASPRFSFCDARSDALCCR